MTKRKKKRFKLKNLFNGHVQSPGTIVFIYSLLLVFIVTVFIVCIFVGFTEYNETNTEKLQMQFESYEIYFNDIIVYSNALPEEIVIYNFNNSAAIESCVLNHDTVTVWVVKCFPRHAKPYYSIKQLLHKGNVLYSFKDAKKSIRKESAKGMILLSLILLLGVLLFAFTVIVGRNPRKFKPCIVRLLFKEGSIKY